MTAEPGTILGPTDITREYLVVVECVDGVCTLGYAQQAEIDAVQQREPRSIAEHKIQLLARPRAIKRGLDRA